MAFANTVKVFADCLPCDLDGQVCKEAKSPAAPPLQVVSTGVEPYVSVHPEIMSDEAHLCDKTTGQPRMQEWVRNDDDLAHILTSEYSKRLINDVLRIKVKQPVALRGCMGVGDYPDVKIMIGIQVAGNLMLRDDDSLHVAGALSFIALPEWSLCSD